MSMVLYFFWDGFSAAGGGATIVGSWSNIVICHGNADRIAAYGNQDRIVTHGNQERIDA